MVVVVVVVARCNHSMSAGFVRRDKGESPGPRRNGLRSMRKPSPLVMATVVNAGSLLLAAAVVWEAVVEELLVVIRESMDGRGRIVVIIIVVFVVAAFLLLFLFLFLLFLLSAWPLSACSATRTVVDCCFRGSTLICSVMGYETTPTGARAAGCLCCCCLSLFLLLTCVVNTLTWMPTVPVKVDGALTFKVEWLGDAQPIHLTTGSVEKVCG